MLILLKEHCDPVQVEKVKEWLREQDLTAREIVGASKTVLGVVGDTSRLEREEVLALPMVEEVQRVQEPYKNANRKFHRTDTVVSCGGVPVGGGQFAIMAGPCSVESEEQIVTLARQVKAAGAKLLRGGAFKPRTSPYVFQGLGEEGLRLLLTAKQETGLPIVTEITEVSQLPLFRDVDVIQVGARNMQNYQLLRALGQTRKPILLKRALSGTVEEWLMSAEYILAGGNPNVILCERGIRTYENATRNTLDLSCVPLLHRLTHLPVVVDPSHATGRSFLVKPMALAAAAAGADGLMIEVHNDPAHAKSDGAQSMTPEQFWDTAACVERIRSFL